MEDAIVIANVCHSGIRLARHESENTAYLYHGSMPDELIDLPMLSSKPITDIPQCFPSCGCLWVCIPL